MTTTGPDPHELADCTIWTRRERAAATYAEGLADRIDTVDTAVAVALLCGLGVEDLSEDDIRLNILHTAARWTAGADHHVYRTADGLVTTPLAPEPDWERVEEPFNPNPCWSVLGAGLAETEAAAHSLAAKAWMFNIDTGLLDRLPTVFVDKSALHDSVQAAAFVRARGVAPGQVERAHGLLRAAGLPISWETLAAAAVALHATDRPAGAATPQTANENAAASADSPTDPQ